MVASVAAWEKNDIKLREAPEACAEAAKANRLRIEAMVLAGEYEEAINANLHSHSGGQPLLLGLLLGLRNDFCSAHELVLTFQGILERALQHVTDETPEGLFLETAGGVCRSRSNGRCIVHCVHFFSCLCVCVCLCVPTVSCYPFRDTRMRGLAVYSQNT